jgi:hypothetical protein
MPTATTSNETEQQALTLPPKLWHAYLAERRMGSKQSLSVSAAFERVPGFTKQDTRERLRAALIEREARDGLVLTEADREAEIAAEAASVEAPAEPEPGSNEAIEADARQRVAQLREQIERMAPEALVDAAAASEQEAAESELAEAERALTNVTRARGELTRREKSAAQQAERERQEGENAAAAKLRPMIAKQKAAVDAVLAAVLPEVLKLRDMQTRAEGHVLGGGGGTFDARSVRFRPDDVESAIRFHCRGAGLFSRVTGRDEPLAPQEAE